VVPWLLLRFVAQICRDGVCIESSGMPWCLWARRWWTWFGDLGAAALRGSWVGWLRVGGTLPHGWWARLASPVPWAAALKGGRGGDLATGSTLRDDGLATLIVWAMR
jgi:hypothetical protein